MSDEGKKGQSPKTPDSVSLRTDIVSLPDTSVLGIEAEVLRITFERPGRQPTVLRTRDEVLLGSHPDCDLVFEERGVSKRHARLVRSEGSWWIEDLGSTNGTTLNSEKVERAPLPENAVVRLVPHGTPITCSAAKVDEPTGLVADLADQVPESVTGIIRTLFDPSEEQQDESPASREDLTVRRIREAAGEARSRWVRKYRLGLIAAASVILVGLVAVILQQQRLGRLSDLAVSIFYDMKQLEIRLAQQGGADAEVAAELSAMEERYDQMLEELGVIDSDMPDEDRLILRMARVFGECELTMPAGFVDRTKRHIERWKGSQRLNQALVRLDELGGADVVAEKMLEHHMAPQFLYLGLQESDYRPDAVGPKTRYGIAKGVWQFIPATAHALGLETGPLVEMRTFDPRDERFDFPKATEAAARYIRDLYLTEAQSSGLLVAASYNWGQGNLRRLLRTMPENPRDRNFWKLLEVHEIPEETETYVFNIFSAAVIGENPELFGFEFSRPLGEGETAD